MAECDRALTYTMMYKSLIMSLELRHGKRVTVSSSKMTFKVTQGYQKSGSVNDKSHTIYCRRTVVAAARFVNRKSASPEGVGEVGRAAVHHPNRQ